MCLLSKEAKAAKKARDDRARARQRRLATMTAEEHKRWAEEEARRLEAEIAAMIAERDLSPRTPEQSKCGTVWSEEDLYRLGYKITPDTHANSRPDARKEEEMN